MEFDDGRLETQWDAVCNSGLPIASLVWSGGKSLHALIKVDAVDKAEHSKRFVICESKLKDLGVVADPQNKNPARWTRAAGFYRGNQFQNGFSVPERAVLSWDELSKREISLAEAYRMSAIPAQAIKSLQLPPRRRLVGGWFCEADLCFVHATRGAGKTWFGLAMARALASEAEFGPWPVNKNGPVLYVDGEMPIEDIDSRIMALGGSSENLVILNHEALFHKTCKVLNLTDPAAQAGITELVLERRVQAVFLDNLSCLFSGVRENDNDDWELILPWLLTLRRHRIAVVIVAHSGRDGKNMRGASRREDAAFSVIRLDALQDTGEPRSGTEFTLRFTKDRNSPMEQPVRHWAFREQPDGKVSLEIQQADADEVLLQWVRDGLTSATEIAEELGLSKGQVSKRASRLIAEGRLVKSGRGYALP
jgi:RecA-family ATPase/biotin operon repressor